MTSQPLNDALRAGQGRCGVWTQHSDPLMLELLSRSGFDYVCLDQQHGSFAGPELITALQAIDHCPATALVRVAWNRPEYIMAALDAGAEAVIVPMVDTPEDAALAVAAGYYPPLGNRSWGPALASFTGKGLLPDTANAAPRVFVMVETAAAIGHVESIAQTPGLAGIYLGPNDLALACGYGRDTYDSNPQVHALLDRTLRACTAAGIPMGLHCSSPQMARYWHEKGVTLMTIATDHALMNVAASEAVAQFHDTRAEHTPERSVDVGKGGY